MFLFQATFDSITYTFTFLVLLVLVAQSCPTLCDPMYYIAHQTSLSMDSLGKNAGVCCHFLLQENLLDPRIKLGSPALQADFLPSEPPGKPTLNNNWVC